MPPNALYALVLVAAIAHAAWNAMVKSSADRLLMLTSIRVFGLIGGLLVATAVPAPALPSIPFLLGAASVHFLYYALMLNAYHFGDLGQVYPIARGMAPLLVALLAALLAGEVLGSLSLLAVLILSTAIFVLAADSPVVNRKAVVFAILTGVAISGYSCLSGIGVRKSESLLGYIAWLEVATGTGMVLTACFLRKPAVLLEFARGPWRTGMMAGALSVTGYAVALWAMSVLPLAPVVAVRETSVVFGAIIGSVFLYEGFAFLRIALSTVTTCRLFPRRKSGHGSRP